METTASLEPPSINNIQPLIESHFYWYLLFEELFNDLYNQWVQQSMVKWISQPTNQEQQMLNDGFLTTF